MHRDEAIARLAETQHGFFTRSQAFGIGFTVDQVRHRLNTGRWRSAHPGVYRIRGWTPAFRDLAFAAHLAVGERSFISGRTAARLWDVAPFADVEILEVLVTDRRRVRVSGVIVHRPRVVPRSDVTKLGIVPITTASRTLIDCVPFLPADQLEEALDSLLRRGLASPGALARRLSTASPLGRLAAARRQDRPTESALELELLRLIEKSGLPEPVRQFVVAGVGRVDFAYPAAKLAIEVDGYAYHSSRVRFDADHERDLRLREVGWTPLRFTATQIRRGPDETVRRIMTQLATNLRG